MNELDYGRGSRMAWSLMLQTCLMHLGADSKEASRVKWVCEREEILRALREACELYGDNDWPDELNLADVIEKHLMRNLQERSK